MDPNATLYLINTEHTIEALNALARWLSRGGFAPDEAGITDEALAAYRDAGLFELACAVNVAIAYGDLSALEGCGFEVLR